MAQKMNIEALRALSWAIDDMIGYLADNSCGDPDCCGGPFYDETQFDHGIAVLGALGIEYDPNPYPTASPPEPPPRQG